MKIENIIDVIVYSMLYYYSLIEKFNITDKLISGMRFTVGLMWSEYMNDIESEECIDLIGVMSGEYSKILKANDANLYRNITQVIISYFDKAKEIDAGMEVIELFNYNYLPGMSITHMQISNIIDFYLNQ